MMLGLELHSDPQTKQHKPAALSKSLANEPGEHRHQNWKRSPVRGRLQRRKDAHKTKPLCFRAGSPQLGAISAFTEGGGAP